MSDTKTAGHSTYPSYKTSGIEWLGDVPEHWETTTIRRYCRVFSGATPDRAILNYWDGGTIPWIASGDVNVRRIFKAQQFITEAGYRASSTRYIRPGSLVLALAGQGRTKGMVATVECRTTCNQSLAAIEPSPQLSDYNFLAYYLESRYTDIRALVGDGLRDGLNLEHIRGIQTPLPPLDEQTAIVRYLDDADQRIRAYVSAKERLIALLEEERQAVIHQAVTRGLDPDVQLKPSGAEWLGDVPEHWAVRRLKQVSTIQAGLTLGKAYRNAELIERPYLRVANVQSGHLDLSEITTVQVPLAEVKKTTLEIGDVLMTEGGDIDKLGRGCMWQGEIPGCLHQNHVFAVRPNPADLNPAFLEAIMGTVQGRKYFHATAKQTTNLAATNRTTLGEFPMCLPSIREQQAIVEHVTKENSTRDAAIHRARCQIQLMEEYRTRLIADVVTGKIDIRRI